MYFSREYYNWALIVNYTELLSYCFLIPILANFSASASVGQRNELFNQEQRRQRDAVGRIEKIEVRYLGLPEDVTLVMNSNISTPFNCAQHLSEGHCKRSALALVDGSVPWDMHRPLQESCTLQLLNFNVSEPHVVNK